MCADFSLRDLCRNKLAYQHVRLQKLVLLYLASLLLSLSYAPEPNPGPTNGATNIADSNNTLHGFVELVTAR